MMSGVGIIPARGGSKGIPGKNIRLLGGIPLVARAIRAANASGAIDTVYVSSESAEILDIASDWGARPILRPDRLADDQASSEAALVHALENIAGGGALPEVTVFLQCTSPFTTAADIDRVAAGLGQSDAMAAFSVVEDHGFLWGLGPDGAGVGINHDPLRARQRRQDRPRQFRETGAVYAMRSAAFMAAKSRFCGPSVPVPIAGPALEIDDPDDWAQAEALAPLLDRRIVAEDRAASIRALVMDFDGVHTDDRVIVDETGREAVIVNRRDGLGVGRLKDAGYRLLILSKERNPVVLRRAEKLGIEALGGIDDKHARLERWRRDAGLDWRQIAYIGNDVNDLACLQAAGLAIAPSDATIQARRAAHWITPAGGGAGAVRAVADMLLGE